MASLCRKTLLPVCFEASSVYQYKSELCFGGYRKSRALEHTHERATLIPSANIYIYIYWRFRERAITHWNIHGIRYQCRLSLMTAWPRIQHLCTASANVSCGVRTHAQLPAVDLKSTPLATRANWHCMQQTSTSQIKNAGVIKWTDILRILQICSTQPELSRIFCIPFHYRHCVRAVKEMDSKSIGLCPQGFESPRCRFFVRWQMNIIQTSACLYIQLSVHTLFHSKTMAHAKHARTSFASLMLHNKKHTQQIHICNHWHWNFDIQRTLVTGHCKPTTPPIRAKYVIQHTMHPLRDSNPQSSD